MAKCSLCSRPSHARGFCSSHYAEQRKLGFPMGESRKRLPRQERLKCGVPDCSEFVVSERHYCKLHQRRFLNHGDPLLVKKVYRYGEANCKIQGCKTRGRLKRGYCPSHYQRLLAHGNPLGGNPSPLVQKAVDHPDGTRTCSQCQVRKSLKEFYADKLSTLGRKAKCKTCVKGIVLNNYNKDPIAKAEKVRTRRLANPELYRQREEERYERDKPKRLDLANKHAQIRRARRANVRIDKGITRRTIRLRDGDRCYYCHKVMDFTPAKKRVFSDDHATLEHLAPLSKGGNHTRDNIVLACRRCNLMKNNKTETEFSTHLNDIEKAKKSLDT